MDRQLMTDIGNTVGMFNRFKPYFHSFSEAAEKNWNGDKGHEVAFIESSDNKILAKGLDHELVIRYRIVQSKDGTLAGELSCSRVCQRLDDKYQEELIYVVYIDRLGNVHEDLDRHGSQFNIGDQEYADVFGYEIIRYLLESQAVAPFEFST
ncbi:hypothetical protein ACS8YF_16965 [Salinisphaera sp. SWV1]|uniref:hypothetical protein n=1 Tax=Salinisphaera sp. SWV1 TaxID=3454139 RepID=UPI003F8281B2